MACEERDSLLFLEMESLVSGDLGLAIQAAAGLAIRPSPKGGMGLFATRNLPQGVELKIPRRLVLDEESASKTVLGARLAEQGIRGQENLVAVLADAR